jgi:hypothetical protein
MKNLLIFLGLLFYSLHINSQSKVVYELKVIDNKKNLLSGISVSLIETTSKKRINSKTNGGFVTFELNYGKEWAVNVGEMKNCDFIEVPEIGIANQNRTITYDMKHYNRVNRAYVDRSTLNLENVDQTKLDNLNFGQNEALVELFLKREDGGPLVNYPVNLTCYKLKIYTLQ